jgi:DNA mismatch repair protein MutL
VVERPINVVKELIENSLDAGATRITVEIADGGSELIRITDDGCGITPEDLPVAVERFATSKAQTVEDVYNISTFGFRGEALAAIGAVSNLQIKSHREGFEPSEINVKFGELSPLLPTAISKGTQISVSKLFNNLPVRRKFLKSARSSEAEILKFIKHFTLINPSLEVIVIFDGEEVYRTYSSQSALDLAKAVFAEDRMMSAHSAYDGCEVDVCASHVAVQRKRRDSIYIGVNGRVIKDAALTQAVVQAYYRLIPGDSYPMAVVNIRLDPASVDVNIHPTKSEVRFESPSELFHYVKSTVEDAIRKFTAAIYAEEADDPALTEMEEAKPTHVFTEEEKRTPFLTARPAFDLRKELKSVPTISIGRADPAPTMNEPSNPMDYKVIGQLDNTYIICETPLGELMIIDQHVAHERILYEKYTNERTQAVPSIVLFDAVVLNNLTAEELECLEAIEGDLNGFGYSYEPFGGNAVKVSRVPLAVSKKDIGKEFLGILSDAIEMKRSKRHDGTILTMSCRNAVKAGDTLSNHDMNYIVNTLFKTQNPHTCPHGRPIVFVMPKATLASNFQRSI